MSSSRRPSGSALPPDANAIILIDSDLDSEPQKLSKRTRSAATARPKADIQPFQKPYMSRSSSEEDVQKRSKRQKGSVSGQKDGSSDSSASETSASPENPRFSDHIDPSEAANSSFDAADARSGAEDVSSDAASSDAANSSEDLNSLDSDILQQVTAKPTTANGSDRNGIKPHENQYSSSSIAATRHYLKKHGIMNFLDRFLPTTASSEDLLQLILKLGFLPKHFPDLQVESDSGEQLIALIKLLHAAMKKVKVMRMRLPNFSTVDNAIDRILAANKILVITGAGISTSVGIPDFRSSRGFYNQLQHLGLSDPQEVFDLEYFHSDPSIFYSIAHLILPPDKASSPLHAFIRLLQDKGKLLRNYTQNIDNLEGNVGITPEKVVQCHGSFAFATCVTCKYKVQGDKIYPEIRKKQIPYCPRCTRKRLQLQKQEQWIPESYGVMKPDITFFGEPLPSRFHEMIKMDLLECDLLLSVGTSLKVSPVADIVEIISKDIPQVLINKDPIEHCSFDVSLLGYCDDVASYLCDKIGSLWRIDHSDYDKIRGHNGSNLELLTVNEHEGVYEIINKERKEREERAQEARKEEIKTSSHDVSTTLLSAEATTVAP